MISSQIFYANNSAKGSKIPKKNVISMDNSTSLLSSLLGSSTQAEHFMQQSFTKRPVVNRNNDISELISLLYDLDIVTMLENSASEKIQVWLKPTETEADQQSKPLDSISVDDARQAYKLYKAGHSLYCRASAELEQQLVPRLLRDLGLGVLTAQTDRHRRGEIETFFSKSGHVTDFHTDFQENFTIMLTGKKRWLFKDSTATMPLRGCTPHFNAIESPDIAEQQLKVNCLGDPTFNVSQILTPNGSEVIIGPGDVLYHPAGIWHRVECLEDSLAINISVIVTSYADLFCSSLQQLLLANPQWRAPVAISKSLQSQESHAILTNIIYSMPSILPLLSPTFMLPTPSYTPINYSVPEDSVDEDDGSDDDEAEENAQTPAHIVRVSDIDVQEYLSNLSSSKNMNTSIKSIVFNSLATLLRESHLHALGGWVPEAAGIELSDDEDCVVVHVGYANEGFESLSRVVVVIPSASSAREGHMWSAAMVEFMKVYSVAMNERHDYLNALPKSSSGLQCQEVNVQDIRERLTQCSDSEDAPKTKKHKNNKENTNKGRKRELVDDAHTVVEKLLCGLHAAGAIDLRL